MLQDVSSQDTQAADVIFVGRQKEQHIYERLLTRKTPWVLLITGLPGSGKSALLRQLAEQTPKEDIHVVTLNFAQLSLRTDVLAILEKLAEQVAPHCDSQKSGGFTKYEEFVRVLEDGRKSVAEMGKVINQIVIARDSSTIRDVEQQFTQTSEASKEGIRQVKARVTTAFYNLISTFSPRRLVIMLDTSEWLNDPGSSEAGQVGQWVTSALVPGLHECTRQKDRQCSFVIASRDHLPLEAVPEQDVIVHTLPMLGQAEVDKYLQNKGMKDPELREQVYEITYGHPLCMSLIGELWQKQQEWGEQAFTIGELKRIPSVQQGLGTKALLQFLGERMLDTRLSWHFSDLARYSALLRSFDRSMLQAIFRDIYSEEKERELMRASYVMLRMDRYTFHDLLREIVATYIRVHEREEWLKYHKRALNYLADPSPRLDWYYHKLACNEKEGIEALERAVQQAYTDGVRERVGTLLLVAHDRTLDLSPTTYAALAYEQGRYYHSGQRWEEAVESYHQSLDLYQKVYDHLGEAKAYAAIADVQRLRKDGNLKTALQYYKQAYAIYWQMCDIPHQAYVLHAIGDVQRLLGEDTCLESYEKALTLYQANNDEINQAVVHRSLGDVLAQRSRNDRDAALKHYEQATKHYKQAFTRDPEKGKTESSNLASIYKAMGDIERSRQNRDSALRNYGEALRFYTVMDDSAGQASTSQAMGDIERSRQNWLTALEHYGEALRFYTVMDDSAGQASTSQGMGDIERSRQNWLTALEHYGESLDFSQKVGDDKKAAYVCQEAGDVLRKLNEKDTSTILEYYNKALGLYKSVGDSAGAAYVYKVMAEVEQACGDPKAQDHYKDALERYEGAKDPRGAAYVCQDIGELEQARQNLDGAQQSYDKALDYYRRVNDWAGAAYACQMSGQVKQARQNLDGAQQDYEQSLRLYQKVGNLSGQAYVYQAIGDVHKSRREWDDALENYEEALGLHRITGNQDGKGSAREAIRELQPNVAR